MTPQDLAERILRDHDARRDKSGGRWSWDDDPDGGKLVALAAMVTRWNVDAEQFEAKLRRLIHLPTGVARPAAERMLSLWIEARRGDLTPPAPLSGANIDIHERRPMLGANIGGADIPSTSPDPRVVDIISGAERGEQVDG